MPTNKEHILSVLKTTRTEFYVIFVIFYYKKNKILV